MPWHIIIWSQFYRWYNREWNLSVTGQDIVTEGGMYKLRPSVKKLYHLRPKVSEWSVSVASRVVNPKHDELRPALSKELHHYTYKMSRI
jgi:hypothetical protein